MTRFVDGVELEDDGLQAPRTEKDFDESLIEMKKDANKVLGESLSYLVRSLFKEGEPQAVKAIEQLGPRGLTFYPGRDYPNNQNLVKVKLTSFSVPGAREFLRVNYGTAVKDLAVYKDDSLLAQDDTLQALIPDLRYLKLMEHKTSSYHYPSMIIMSMNQRLRDIPTLAFFDKNPSENTPSLARQCQIEQLYRTLLPTTADMLKTARYYGINDISDVLQELSSVIKLYEDAWKST